MAGFSSFICAYLSRLPFHVQSAMPRESAPPSFSPKSSLVSHFALTGVPRPWLVWPKDRKYIRILNGQVATIHRHCSETAFHTFLNHVLVFSFVT